MHHRFAPRLACVLLLAPLLVGCRRDGAVQEPPNFSARQAEQLLGAPTEVAMFVDLAGIRGDAIYGPLLARGRPGTVGATRELRWMVSGVDRVDVWAVGLGGSAQDVTALAVVRSGRLRESDLGAGGLGLALERRLVLPSGAVMFVVNTRGVRTVMFMVDGSLVFASGAAMAPAQLHYTGSRSLPPALDWGRDALAGIHGRQPALARAGSSYWDHALAASIVWRTGRHGDIVAGATFDDAASAEQALEKAQELPEAREENQGRCSALAQAGVQVERSRWTVSVTVTGVPAVLAAALDDRLCGG